MNTLLHPLSRAIRQQPVDGWLFYGFHHRDPLADELLSIPPEAVNTRRWFYLLRDTPEECVRISHHIEAGILSHLPGKEFFYSSFDELKRILLNLSGLTLAAQVSPELPVLSYLDSGTAELLTDAGIELTSSALLIQQVKGTLDQDQIGSHCRAADHLAEIVELFTEETRTALRERRRITEGDLQQLVLDQFAKRGLLTDHPPIVAWDSACADPHYAPHDGGALIEPDGVLQLDLWAKEGNAGGIYADISWVFYTGTDLPSEAHNIFGTVAAARDQVLDFLSREMPKRRVSGYEADTVARRVLIEAGFERGIRHRTGHGIDSLPHGYGVNLDSIEFPDSRYFTEGSCFSVEPGIYLDTIGMRTEINAYISGNQPLISGRRPQQHIICLGS